MKLYPLTENFKVIVISVISNIIHRFNNGFFFSDTRKKESWIATLTLGPKDRYIEFAIRLRFTFAQGRKYQYSKLYYNSQTTQGFHESRVICFQPLHRKRFEHIRISLPEEVIASGFMAIRIDGIPYSEGEFDLKRIRTVTGDTESELTQLANWASKRQYVREQVIESENIFRSSLPHYPESLSLELTPRCNLHCPHCSSHGTPEHNDYHNELPEMSPDLFEKIAHELFPHITALSLVGRGEPTVASDELWDRCVTLVKRYGVKISCVTNGHFIKRRFTEDLLPYVDELCVSIDGNSPETHRHNRGGSSLQKVLENIAYFHRLRQNSQLARRPKLSFYWTLMTNNVAELPEFIRYSSQFDPDYFAIRHLVLFHDKDRERSLIGQPEKVNPFLKEAYSELNLRDIHFEAPPLMDESNNVEKISSNIFVPEPINDQETSLDGLQTIDPDYFSEQCTWIYRTGIISCNGEVTTCGKHWSEIVGILNDETSFYDVWNGSRMRSLRTTFNTPQMWQQCRRCWLREVKWHSQRQAKDSGNNFDHDKQSVYTPAAWDYRAWP